MRKNTRNKRRVLFLEASGGGGHISITTAVIQALLKLYPSVEFVRADVIPPLAQKLYQLASRKFVNAFLLIYRATDNNKGEFFASRLNHLVSREKLKKAIVESEPDVIFSDYLLAIGEIPKILKEIGRQVPFIVFVPDPFTVHGIYLSKRADLTLVSTLTAYQAALSRGIDPQRLEITGHPVREEFVGNEKGVKIYRQEFGLDPDAFTILFGGSGHGAEKTLEILIHLGARPSGNLIKRLVVSANLDYKTYYKLFFKIFKRRYKSMPPFQIICVCGDNTELKEDLEMLEFPDYMKPFIYLHADNMASLVKASDLVVGKAGPNILFESVMAKKPFLATYHIKGQEDGNIDFIRSAQLGFVEENPQKMAALIEAILRSKRLLDYANSGISYVYKEHKEASAKIAGHIMRYLDKN